VRRSRPDTARLRALFVATANPRGYRFRPKFLRDLRITRMGALTTRPEEAWREGITGRRERLTLQVDDQAGACKVSARISPSLEAQRSALAWTLTVA